VKQANVAKQATPVYVAKQDFEANAAKLELRVFRASRA
jgi:hypothetical protein